MQTLSSVEAHQPNHAIGDSHWRLTLSSEESESQSPLEQISKVRFTGEALDGTIVAPIAHAPNVPEENIIVVVATLGDPLDQGKLVLHQGPDCHQYLAGLSWRPKLCKSLLLHLVQEASVQDPHAVNGRLGDVVGPHLHVVLFLVCVCVRG